MGAFQILWVSKVIVRNVVAVLVKVLSVDAYLHFSEKKDPSKRRFLRNLRPEPS
jgi:hypothetical protein